MVNEEYYLLGKFIKFHGNQGSLVLWLDTDEPELYKDITSCFIKRDGLMIPIIISSSKWLSNNKLLVRLSGINKANELDAFLNKKIYLPLSLLPKLKGNKFYYHEVLGFSCFTIEKIFIGKLKSIFDNSKPPLFSIEKDGKTLLLPIIDQFLENVDRENSELIFNLPKGTLDLFE